MDLGAIVFAICGFSLVCLGILAVIVFVLLRFAGGIFLGPLGELLAQQSPDDRLDDDYRPATYGRRSRLREIRQSLDFDPLSKAQNRGKSGTEGDSPSLRRLGSGNRFDRSLGSSSRRRAREDGEEIYDDEDGGLF